MSNSEQDDDSIDKLLSELKNLSDMLEDKSPQDNGLPDSPPTEQLAEEMDRTASPGLPVIRSFREISDQIPLLQDVISLGNAESLQPLDASSLSVSSAVSRPLEFGTQPNPDLEFDDLLEPDTSQSPQEQDTFDHPPSPNRSHGGNESGPDTAAHESEQPVLRQQLLEQLIDDSIDDILVAVKRILKDRLALLATQLDDQDFQTPPADEGSEQLGDHTINFLAFPFTPED